MAARARKSFNEQLWNEKADCLYDGVNGEDRDASIRPNQIFAISLTHSMVSKSQAKRILRVVERELLTPRGLRTLSPADPRYIGRYEGDPRSRDGAYHQGTVWPWLMGPYITAYVRTFGDETGQQFAPEWLSDFETHLTEACLGQVSEIFDGDAPHTARGCVAQVWSVVELLRAEAEVVYEKKVLDTPPAPKYLNSVLQTRDFEGVRRRQVQRKRSVRCACERGDCCPK
jgi:glycogen debranching enzyme